jgi:putative endopeptidase
MNNKSKKNVNKDKKHFTRSNKKNENKNVEKNKKVIQSQFCESNYKSFEKDIVSLDKNSKNYEEFLIKRFNTPFAPLKIKPEDDFYTYVNFNWLQETEKKTSNYDKTEKYFTQVDSFRTIQNKVYIELIDKVKSYIKDNHSQKATCVKSVYNSLLHLNSKYLDKHIEKVIFDHSEYTKRDDLWGYLAEINGNEIVGWGCPLQWKVLPDDKNSSIYINNITFPQLSLYDYMLYALDVPGDKPEMKKYKKNVKENYIKYIKEIFDSCLGKNNSYNLNAEDVFNVEGDILEAFGCNGVKKDSPEYYNIVKKNEAFSDYGFNWEQFSHLLGFKETPATFLCPGLSYLKCTCKLLKDNWKSEKWKSYWYYIYFRQIIRFDAKRRYIHFNFNEKFLYGQQEIFPSNIYPIFGLSITFNTLLSEEYIKDNMNLQRVNYVKTMAQDLLTVYKRKVQYDTKWMSPNTKKYALLKLNHLKLEVAQPKKLREDPLLDYNDDAWHNMILINKWRKNKFISLVGKPIVDIPEFDWKAFKLVGTQTYIVNAFYTPSKNSIYIPLAYLQKPFVDLEERGIEYNLSTIGYTLAHEMSHSLDEMGSKYDYKGNLRDWWTSKDKHSYKRIINDVIAQYEMYAKRDGIDFDASIGIGEDMADISAMWICEEFLSDFQLKNEDIPAIAYLSFKAFFTYFAVNQKQFVYKKALDAQLKTNPHPLDKYRTNIPLSRLSLFRSMYNVKKDDGMWWYNACAIWQECTIGRYMKSIRKSNLL